ncbi:hypothetical protein LZ31DRAFT_549427 [Colletotrichum somersetense]|nr:hypothetical protein LZ31DRAFT_549427 [Colletotrichum somersetense]
MYSLKFILGALAAPFVSNSGVYAACRTVESNKSLTPPFLFFCHIHVIHLGVLTNARYIVSEHLPERRNFLWWFQR